MNQDHPLKTIWVFRTSVTSSIDIRKLKPILDAVLQKGDKYIFDLEDCDHILRVETQSVSAATIMRNLEQAGYTCAELDDSVSVKLDEINLDAYFPEMKANAS